MNVGKLDQYLILEHFNIYIMWTIIIIFMIIVVLNVIILLFPNGFLKRASLSGAIKSIKGICERNKDENMVKVSKSLKYDFH